MKKDLPAPELAALARETFEYVKFLNELGVELVEVPLVTNDSARHQPPSSGTSVISQPKQTKPADSAPRDERNAASTDQPALPRTAHIPQLLFEEFQSSPAETQLDQHVANADSLGESTESFEDIWVEVGDCRRCPLWEGRTNIVHTEGNHKARLMFVGEAPGADEDSQARPFIGRAGQLLNKIIEAMGLRREEVLIGNVNRCRPPGNRAPTLLEAATCKPYIVREIAAARPEIIVVLGNTALQNLLGTKQGVTSLRGKFQDFHGIKVMPTYHPAYLLRNPAKKREVWEDMKKVRDYLDGKISY